MEEKFVVACFCKDSKQPSRSHYHCPFCEFRILARAGIFIHHLKSTHGIVSDKRQERPSTLKRKSDTLKDDFDSKRDQYACQHCKAVLSSTKNLRRHIRDTHNLDTTPTICIDVKKGIYVTPKYDHSPVFPIHVVKSTNPPKIDCEEENCRQFMRIAHSSGSPGKECLHLERTNRGKPYSKPAALTSTSLKDMLSKGLMSSEWGVKCEELNNAANNLGVDSVFPICFKDEGYSERWHFFSVFTNETDNWCQFGRTRVTFDAVAGQWNCKCRGTGKSHRCIHRMMGMWWIFQESPGILVATADIQAEDIDDLESHMFESNIACEPDNVNTHKICVMTEYLLNHKCIPCLQELPLDLRTLEKQPPLCFIPTEDTCPYCPGPTPPALNPPKMVTTQGMVYGMNFVKKGKDKVSLLR
ncbi:uncharacterized protein si:ch211-10d23.5 [Centropristis striata]|uniref:uncharacterized protein si:ch211-10d23.5 n=1 Tax=Centropristis striata TaxID=184440 RepID=UPI0027DEC69F|nr:uncharacterized protein si:ch211-10d23.5 [Centropristis striata]